VQVRISKAPQIETCTLILHTETSVNITYGTPHSQSVAESPEQEMEQEAIQIQEEGKGPSFSSPMPFEDAVSTYTPYKSNFRLPAIFENSAEDVSNTSIVYAGTSKPVNEIFQAGMDSPLSRDSSKEQPSKTRPRFPTFSRPMRKICESLSTLGRKHRSFPASISSLDYTLGALSIEAPEPTNTSQLPTLIQEREPFPASVSFEEHYQPCEGSEDQFSEKSPAGTETLPEKEDLLYSNYCSAFDPEIESSSTSKQSSQQSVSSFVPFRTAVEIAREATSLRGEGFSMPQILLKRSKYELSEWTCRRAIEDCRALGETKDRLQCQLFLVHFLVTLDRNSDAFQLAVATLIEHFTLQPGSKPGLNSSGVQKQRKEVFSALEKVHSKMRFNLAALVLLRVVGSLETISCGEQNRPDWDTTHDPFDIWKKFVRLGVEYSKQGQFGAAEQCFLFPEPQASHATEKELMSELVRFHMEYSLHYRRRQDMTVSCLEHLKRAFEYMRAALVTTDQYDEILAAGLKEILVETTPPGGINNPETLAWEAAREAYDALTTSTQRPGFEPRAKPKEGRKRGAQSDRMPPSSSSHASSKLTRSTLSSKPGKTYSAGSYSSWVSNSQFNVDHKR
jgi:hypothetical protein